MIKNNKKFLIVGFGGMGCRHAQSLINSFHDSIIHIYEPNNSVYEKNLNLIGQASNNNIIKLSNLNEIQSKYDFCVIATSSGPRFEILESLLNYDISYFLVEKVVFQTNTQFDKIQKLNKNKNIYVNFVNRYFKNYIDIKKDINNQPFTMDIIGGDYGLGCNALHYFDLFKYFGANNVKLDKFNLKESYNENKRGAEYKEVLGQISINSSDGCSLNISSEIDRGGGVELIIKTSKSTHLLNEELLNHIEYSSNHIISSPFKIEYTSSLTGKIFKDIMDSKCLLPNLYETKDIHSILFESVNKTLKLKINDICPVT